MWFRCEFPTSTWRKWKRDHHVTSPAGGGVGGAEVQRRRRIKRRRPPPVARQSAFQSRADPTHLLPSFHPRPVPHASFYFCKLFVTWNTFANKNRKRKNKHPTRSRFSSARTWDADFSLCFFVASSLIFSLKIFQCKQCAYKRILRLFSKLLLKLVLVPDNSFVYFCAVHF